MMNIMSKSYIAGWLLLAGMAGQSHAAIADGLAGHWTFDETAGVSAKDSSGRGNDGAVSNSMGDGPQWGTGQIGGALTFRGPGLGDDYVAIPQYPAPTNAFSVSAWVYADPLEVWPQSTIVENGLASSGPIGLVLRLKDRDQDFGPLGDTTTDSYSRININENVGFPTASWQHVGVVAEGTTIRLYRNGAEVAVSTNYSGTLVAPVSPALGIGATLDDTGAASGGFWQGKIDDVGVWIQALTPAQMASIFNAGKAGKDLTKADQYQNLPPVITEQPQNASRFVGETVAFSVKASGAGPITYQWQLNGQPISDATNAAYNIASVKESDAGDYIVVVTNPGGGVPSQKAVLTVQKTTLATGMVGYWKFDEKQGETASDASSFSNPGQLGNYSGDNSQWVAGKIGGALQLGGPDAQHYVLVADFPKPTNTITVSLWAWADSRPTWASFVKNWGGAVAGQFHFGLFSGGGQENIYIKQADGKTPNTSDTELFPLGSWQHVAFTCDGSKVRLYRNGAQVAIVDYNGTLIPPSASALGIGAKLTDDGSMADTGAPGYWHGKMDDVALWNRGLSPSEITAVYTAGMDGKGALEADVTKVIAPTISSQPSDITAFEGDAITLSVGAAGTPPLTFQWKKDNQILPGATNSSLAIANARKTDAGSYRVEIANAGGTIASNPANLAVQSRPPAILVSEWKFEQNLSDTSTNANDGAAIGTVEYVAGVSGRAVRLAPGNPVVNSAANGLPVLGSDSWSLNLWLKLSEEPKSLAYLAGFGPVTDKGAGTARGLLAFTGAKNNNVYVWGSNRDTPGGAPFPIGRWAMATVTYDGANGATTIYLDGQNIGQNLQPRADIPEGDYQISLAPTSNWNIDAGGDFDEFTLWNGVLNLEQLRQLLSVGAVPETKLSVSLKGAAVTISWPADATGFVLESTDTLAASQWTPVAGTQNNTVTLNADGKSRFFRLRK
jgi:hypothetical protein